MSEPITDSAKRMSVLFVDLAEFLRWLAAEFEYLRYKSQKKLREMNR